MRFRRRENVRCFLKISNAKKRVRNIFRTLFYVQKALSLILTLRGSVRVMSCNKTIILYLFEQKTKYGTKKADKYVFFVKRELY
jgi:hypothetical protein